MASTMNNTNRTNTNINTPPIPQPSSGGGEFDGSDFSNNLFSDLAQVLTSFGEQVTKQFLSQVMGLGGDILLAMAPLGILTCVVSAIRVGGKKWLKALVGRARKSRITAEMEILSSTSDTVCELWSGTEIVRELGQPLWTLTTKAGPEIDPRRTVLEDWSGGDGVFRYALLVSMQFAPYSNIAVQSDEDSPVFGSLPESFAKPLPRLCAWGIFSAFMLRLASKMTAISGHLERRPLLQGDNDTTFCWEHSAMSKLTNIVRDSKPAVDDDEAYMLVYPAFETYGLFSEADG